MLFLVLLDDVFFLQDLQSEKLFVFLSGDQADFGVCPLPDYAVEMEIVHSSVIH